MFDLFLAFLHYISPIIPLILISYTKIFQNAEIFLISSLSEFSFFLLPEISYIDISDVITFNMKKKDQSCSLQLIIMAELDSLIQSTVLTYSILLWFAFFLIVGPSGAVQTVSSKAP